MCDSVCVVMPTYNEAQNLTITLTGVFAHNPEVHILVVDDASPDGTGELADAMAQHDDRVHVMHRQGKQGLGPAYIAGFDWAIAHGYSIICEMDMDGSHRPQDLTKLLERMRDPQVDAVIGSRRVRGGSSQGWPWYRNLISSCGSWYARFMLGISIRDMTAGFRAYRSAALQQLNLHDIAANGYVFQIDMTRRLAAKGARIVEVPIVFPQRAYGESKMSLGIVAEAMKKVTIWGCERMWRSLVRIFRDNGKAQ